MKHLATVVYFKVVDFSCSFCGRIPGLAKHKLLKCEPLKIRKMRVFDQLYIYIESSRLLVQAQFGFSKGKSTASVVQCLIKAIEGSFETRKTTSGLLYDLSRAFDCVSHNIFGHEARIIWISGGALQIVISGIWSYPESYLENISRVFSWEARPLVPPLWSILSQKFLFWAHLYLFFQLITCIFILILRFVCLLSFVWSLWSFFSRVSCKWVVL